MSTVASYTLPEATRRELAIQLVAALGAEYPEWTVEAEIQDLTNSSGLPLTRCITDEQGRVIGSASLLPTDEVTGYADVTPWLGDLYVVPAHRNAGLGRTLVSAIVDEARSRGFATLHLVTSDAVDWYRALGWSEIERVDVHGHSMTYMRISL